MTNTFSPEGRKRAVRLVLDHAQKYPSRWQKMVSISAKIGCSGHSRNEWMKKAEVDAGKRAGIIAGRAQIPGIPQGHLMLRTPRQAHGCGGTA